MYKINLYIRRMSKLEVVYLHGGLMVQKSKSNAPPNSREISNASDVSTRRTKLEKYEMT